MTNKELLLDTLNKEVPIFVRVLEALPEDKLDWKPEEKSRTAKEMIQTFVGEAWMYNEVAQGKDIDMSQQSEMAPFTNTMDSIKSFTSMMEAAKMSIASMSDEAWNGDAKIVFPVGNWEDKRGAMLWGFLLDLIHHRGQLSVYIRPMGGKVPSIYGPSADSASAM